MGAVPSGDAGAARRWFSRVAWLGIAANVLMAVPTVVAPERMLMFSRLPVPDPIMWTQFAALLLVLLSAMYVPAALDPVRSRAVAVLATVARAAGVLFFLLLQPEIYRLLGYFDLGFFVAQGWLLWRMS